MKRLLFLGAGEIGTALAHVIDDRAVIEMWDKDPKRARKMRSLDACVPEADVIFVCIPSWAVREVMMSIKPFLKPKTVIVSLAKGIEEKTLKTMDAVLAASLPAKQPFGILGGPLLAEELMADLPGIAVFASTPKTAYKELASLFAGSMVRLEHESDPHTVALTAVLKNVYAVGLGIADGLGWGWNGKGWLAAQALTEMAAIVKLLKGNPALVDGSAGAGDFLATAMSPDSRNQSTGREIAMTGTCRIQSEGCRSISSVLLLLKKNVRHFPLLTAIHSIITEQQKAEHVFHDLLTPRRGA